MNIAAKNITPTVTTGPLPASRKIYIRGDIHPDICVPMREISLHPTSGEPPVVVYDLSEAQKEGLDAMAARYREGGDLYMPVQTLQHSGE